MTDFSTTLTTNGPTTSVGLVNEMPLAFNAEALMTAAIANAAPLETIERLITMRRELKAEWAKEKFMWAMAELQGTMPIIKKDTDGGKTNSGIVAYKYAPLDSIVSQVKAMIMSNGFSYLPLTEEKNGMYSVTIVVRHVNGHEERTTFSVPASTKTGVMSNPQVTASSYTYAKRHAFCNAFGIITGDSDDDASPQANGTASGLALEKTPFEKLMSAIEKTDNVDKLIEWKQSVMDSVRFNQEEKRAVIEKINNKLP